VIESINCLAREISNLLLPLPESTETGTDIQDLPVSEIPDSVAL
jgi:hypothetical protein